MVIEEKTNKILGIQIIGNHATELIHEACVLLKFSATANDVINIIHGHPTLSEMFSEVAHLAIGEPLHV